MSKDKDIRWIQRLSNYTMALAQLRRAVMQAREKKLSELETQGLIQAFEFTHELAWNLMKDYFEYQGNTAITGSRDAIREAFSKGLISNGEVWMSTINSRNKSSHTYNEDTANEIYQLILLDYYPLFEAFRERMEELSNAVN